MKRLVFRKYDTRKLGLLRWWVLLAALLLAMFLVSQFVLGVSLVSGDSMEPAISDGQLVFYNRLVTSYDYGDVVSIRMPSGQLYVKRVVALPGDTVELRDGVLYVNGAAEAPGYAMGTTLAEGESVTYPLTVEENRLFLLGDNREGSVDSRSFGTVSYRQVLGVLLGNYGPH